MRRSQWNWVSTLSELEKVESVREDGSMVPVTEPSTIRVVSSLSFLFCPPEIIIVSFIGHIPTCQVQC